MIWSLVHKVSRLLKHATSACISSIPAQSTTDLPKLTAEWCTEPLKAMLVRMSLRLAMSFSSGHASAARSGWPFVFTSSQKAKISMSSITGTCHISIGLAFSGRWFKSECTQGSAGHILQADNVVQLGLKLVREWAQDSRATFRFLRSSCHIASLVIGIMNDQASCQASPAKF